MAVIGINVTSQDPIHGYEAITPNKPRWSNAIYCQQDHVDDLYQTWQKLADEFDHYQTTGTFEKAENAFAEFRESENKLRAMKDAEMATAYDAEFTDSEDASIDENILRNGG
jgi:hypothetical protein